MRTLLLLPVLSLICAGLCLAEVYFKEEFDDSWQDRWVQSKHKDDYGKWELSAGKWYGDEKRDTGLKTSQDARFYAISAKFPKKFSNRGKTTVIQFTVKHDQNIDCGGGYVKVMASDIDQADFHGETPYNVMFGPDICGPGTKKVHVILSYKGKNQQVKKEVRCKDDELSHLYTLILSPDNTYEVQIDGEKAESGEIEKDFDLLPAKKIKDPDAKKPTDWDDKEYIDDPDDSKPDDWEKPEHIPDPEAKKPDDWDDEMDGEWEAPMIDNPEFKGEWKPKQVKNPAYKGKWIHPEIDNPEYAPDDELYLYNDWGAIGIDIWQVKSGSIFNNILVTDSVDEAKAHAAERFEPLKEAEKQKKEEHDEAERKRWEEEDKKRKEEEEAKKKEKGDEDEAEEEDEDDEEVDTKKKEKKPKKEAEKEDHDEL